MIREATAADIAAIVRLTTSLARVTAMPIEVDPSWTAAFVARTIADQKGLALVVELGGSVEGMIVATVGQSSVSPALIAVEHGWHCSKSASGWGLKLLRAYEKWARNQGCVMARMSTAYGSPLGSILVKRHGYAFAETAMAKVL